MASSLGAEQLGERGAEGAGAEDGGGGGHGGIQAWDQLRGLRVEAVLGAVAQALDVGAVFPDGEHGDDDGEDEAAVCSRCRPGKCRPWMPVNRTGVSSGRRGGGADAGDRDVAGGEEEQQPDDDQQDDGDGHQGDQHSGGGGDALAALEADPGRVVVAEDGGEGGEDVERSGP